LIVLTGPQGTDDETGYLAEMAGLYGAVPAYDVTGEWATATALYCLAGWEKCSHAVADVTIAETFGLTVYHLAA
jgi:hypothetical protein